VRSELGNRQRTRVSVLVRRPAARNGWFVGSGMAGDRQAERIGQGAVLAVGGVPPSGDGKGGNPRVFFASRLRLRMNSRPTERIWAAAYAGCPFAGCCVRLLNRLRTSASIVVRCAVHCTSDRPGRCRDTRHRLASEARAIRTLWVIRPSLDGFLKREWCVAPVARSAFGAKRWVAC